MQYYNTDILIIGLLLQAAVVLFELPFDENHKNTQAILFKLYRRLYSMWADDNTRGQTPPDWWGDIPCPSHTGRIWRGALYPNPPQTISTFAHKMVHVTVSAFWEPLKATFHRPIKVWTVGLVTAQAGRWLQSLVVQATLCCVNGDTSFPDSVM